MASTGSENRENRRNLATATKVVATELPPQKLTLSILDRFKALLRQRDHELRGSAEDDTVTPPSAEEIVHFYDLLLSELTLNSKPIITDLTIIAGDQKEHGKGIAEGICARILEAPVEQKLPSLYLLDSIVKNIGREYVTYFSYCLPEVFCEAYRQVQPDQHNAMRHLFGTWSAVFPPSVLRKIEAKLQFSPSANHQSSGLTPSRASESPRPTHGIHVNPKYLRQLEHSTVDGNIQQARGASALKMFGQKPSIGYDEFDLGQAELVSSQAGDPRLSSTGNAVEEFAADHSSRRLADRSSTAHLKFKYGLGRATGGDEEMSSLHGKHYAGGNHTCFETKTMYNVSNGHEHLQPRALIDAYGNDTGKRSFNDKPLLGQRHNIKGIDNKVVTPSWQNTEEEEFDWEDLSRPLVDRSRSNDFLSTSVPPFGRVSFRPAFGVRRASPLEANQAQLPALDNSSMIAEDAVPLLSFGRGSMGKIPGFRAERNHILDSRYLQEAWNMPSHLAKGRGRNFHLPLLASGMSSSDGEKSLVDKLPDADSKIHGPQSIISRFGSSNLDSISVEVRPAVVPASVGVRPPLNVHNSHPLPLQPIFSQKKQMKSQFDSINSSNNVNNRGPNGYLYDQQLDGFGNKELSAMKLSQLSNQRAGLISLNQRNQVQVTPLQPQFLPSQGAHPSAAAVVPPHLVAPRLNHGYNPQMHGAAVSSVLSKPVTGAQLMLPVQNIPNSSLHLQGGTLPLPPGVPPTSSQMIPLTQNAVPVVANQPTSISGLIGSLMAQGLISLTRPTPVQDSVGVEFNADLLKVRHESAISSLYTDLPRQCKTCGLRFKCQEEHSSHMDWHVTKNRMSKNRKQKPSRKWFVSASMWLSGAEALGSEAVPGFLPTEVIVEKKDDEEMAVPADDDQNACALCGEPFDDFYSDETEEWMYKGAVYLNMPSGLTAGMDRSQLGPIVHAKCRSESSVVSPEDFRQDERVCFSLVEPFIVFIYLHAAESLTLLRLSLSLVFCWRSLPFIHVCIVWEQLTDFSLTE
ncbi:hypothetical protein F2P56_009504 [Juglans regia]|uniref:CID domain-containing protein n=1 Tax=Juglans regia TaxID=51240 RepID=A0A834D060_JUGRE|nr:hypothetical protein F2P56_009504 [Juglans regia]